jgi:Legionella pneumophila major outer membrane protein precursor
MSKSRQILLAGVSSLALATSAPAVMAADLPPRPPIASKAPPPVPAAPNRWTVWVEGGAQGVLGDPFVPALNPPFDAKPRNWGPKGAAGLTYHFDSFWLVSLDFGYGANRRTLNSFQVACTSPLCTSSPTHGANSATRKEYGWVTDIMFGRDVGLGSGTAQLEGGMRIADIRGTTSGNIAWAKTSVGTGQSVYSQTNKFFGIGPRVALDGTVPLSGPWYLDYQFGVAGLFADRSTNQTSSMSGIGCFGPCPLNGSISSNGLVFNPNAMIGLSYAFSPSVKMTINYQVDAYLDAFRVFNAAGAPTYTNRIDQGPNLRLTWLFGG